MNDLIFKLLMFSLVFPFHVQGQQNEEEHRLFGGSDPIILTIRTDLLKLLNSREADSEYQVATLIMKNSAEETTRFNIEVETRGNFRRDSANCDFPPIRLNFKKKDIVDSYFEGNEKIKIVTHCKTQVPQFDVFVVREYVTYKIYNALTPASFKVRFARITYEDTSNNLESIERNGFLIEDIDHLAERNQMKEYEEPLNILDLDKKNAILLSLFQYMIGNTDWIVNMSKNLKTITDGSTFYAIPYDFDYTLLVGTDYTLGGGRSFLSEPVQEYRGPCYELEDIIPIADEILDKRKEILRTISKEKLLDYESKMHMKNFIGTFFYIIKSENRIRENILAECN
jgi:hypothetical protein